jgi:hypothetical protein
MITTTEIELALAKYFDYRVNLIVPNICWGMGMHECDLFILTKAGCIYEVEIKRLKHDLIADTKKRHKHNDKRVKHLFFCITENLVPHIDYIPLRAGILVIDDKGHIKKLREPAFGSSYKATEKERLNLSRLGTMRIWALKRTIVKLRKKVKNAN